MSPNTAHVDLHCHTRASRDSIADPVSLLTRAVERGLTHLAITDHDTIDGALHAAASAPEGLTVIVGCEVLTTGGDLSSCSSSARSPWASAGARRSRPDGSRGP